MTPPRSEPNLPQRIRLRLAERKPSVSQSRSGIRAAVLAPLFWRSADRSVRVWLARRSENLRTHQGQIALPGGKWEPEDRDLRETALRETEEEIGLESTRVEVLGSLDELDTRTGYVITPFVGWIDETFVPAALSSEVAHVFSAPLTLFEAPPQTVKFPALLGDTPVPCWRHEGETIWGATAAILRNLVRTIEPGRLEKQD